MDTKMAIEIAKLWRAGKMIGGDEDEVRDALLGHVEALEKALHRLVKAVELFDNETDGGLSKWDPAVTEAKDLLGTSS